MPKPKINENKKDFVIRCIPIVIKAGTAKDDMQAAAICNSMFENNGKHSEWISGLALGDSTQPKKEIMLFPFGEFNHPQYGKLTFDMQFFNDIIKNYDNKVLLTTPFMDEEHKKGKALAWFNKPPYIRQGLGLFIQPEYTELGDKTLSSKEYKYFSPWFEDYTDPASKKTFKNVLRGGAATNIPFLKIMPPIFDDTKLNETQKVVDIKLSDLIFDSMSGGESNLDESVNMQKSENQNKGDLKMLEKLKKIFSLSENATEDEVIAKLNEIIGKNKELSDKIESLNKKDGSDKQLSEKLNATEKRLSEVSMKLVKRDLNEVISKALSEGRIKPVDKEYWEKRFLADPENLKLDIEHMPVNKMLGEIGSSNDNPSSNEDVGKKLSEMSAKMASEKKISIGDAMNVILAENPELAKEYGNKYFGGAR